MSKSDELDRRRAAAFAWRSTIPRETDDLPEEEPADAQETAVGQGHETAAGTRDPAPPAAVAKRDKREPPDVCAELTDAIEQVLRGAEVDLLGALAPLLRHAGDVAREPLRSGALPMAERTPAQPRVPLPPRALGRRLGRRDLDSLAPLQPPQAARAPG